jgi:hypothetical protein
MTADALPLLTYSALRALTAQLLAVLLHRPAGLYRALAQTLSYLEAMVLGGLAQVVAWDGMTEGLVAGPACNPVPPPPPRPGRRPRPRRDLWAGLIARTTRLLVLLRDQEAARLRMARRIARRPAVGPRLIARWQALQEQDPPWALLVLYPEPRERAPDSS